MRLLLLFPLVTGCLIAISLLSVEVPNRIGNEIKALWSNVSDSLASMHSKNDRLLAVGHSSGSERILQLETYEDLEYGFSVAIPVGWRRIVTADSSSEPVTGAAATAASSGEASSLEPGYAVGFESVQQHAHDPFADYILIEILPGDASGLFTADAALRQPATIDGRDTGFDRLEIDHVDSGLIDVDLIVYQAEISGVGYTVGLYAIGEPVREHLLATAFEVMMQTFKMVGDPFSIS